MKRCDFPWTLAVIAIAIAATAAAFASPAIRDALVADDRIARGQLWRALTGPFVHATWGHLVRDLALVAIAGVAYEAPLRMPWLFVAGLVLPELAVLIDGASSYCGLSGLSHALLAAALAFEVVRRRGRARAIVLALSAIAALKPIYELATGAPAFAMSLGDGVRQAPLAHVVGVCIGIAAGLVAGCIREVPSADGAPHRLHRIARHHVARTRATRQPRDGADGRDDALPGDVGGRKAHRDLQLRPGG